MSPVKPRELEPCKIDHEAMRPFFGWLPLDRVKRTFKYTSQMMKMPSSTYLRKRHQNSHPAANIYRRNDVDYTDTVYFDTPAVDGGQTKAQLFTARNSKISSVHALKGEDEKDILYAIEDRINKHGAPEKLAADNSAVYRGSLIQQYLRGLYIRFWQTESYHQNQNHCENVWETLKNATNRLLDFTNSPKNFALLALLFMVYCCNHTVDATLADGKRSPYMLATGRSDDISALL